MGALSFITKGMQVCKNVDADRLTWDKEYREAIVEFFAPTKEHQGKAKSNADKCSVLKMRV
ncbi:MAG: hypothetical protein MUQ43_09005 [Reinekea forsetii]|nr:hypothetical protein [Reinekea forsetii]